MSMSSQELEPISELFTAQGRELVGRARRLLRSPSDAEDAVQDAMLALIEAPYLLGGVEEWISPTALAPAPTKGPKDIWFFRMDARPRAGVDRA
jgi:hypothetical protein